MPRILCFIILLVQCCALPLKAQPILDEIIVTAAKSETLRRDTTASVGILDEQELDRISHTHINETLHRVPGTWISRGNGQEHLTAIRSPVLTGAGSCGAFLMAQDGISLRAPGFCNVNELFESVSELADRIEVIKGPASSTHGSNALHGLVNILTPSPSEGIRRMSLESGPNDYYRGKLSYSTASMRLDVSGTSDGGYKDDSGYDQQKLHFKYKASTERSEVTTSLTYTNLNQETAGFIRGHEVYKDSGSRRDNPNPEAYRDAQSLRLMSRIDRNLDKGRIILTPYLRSVEMEFLQHFLPGQAIEENGHDSIGLQSLWINESASLRVGIELEITDGYLKEFQPGPTIGSNFLSETIPQGWHYNYDVRADLAGFFIRHQANLSKHLQLTSSLRYQHIKYDYDNHMLSGRTRADGSTCGFGGCRFSRPEDRNDTFNNWSPTIGVTYLLASGNQVYGSLSRGFRAPQATEMYRLQSGQQISEIDSVEMDAIDLGYRGQHGELSFDFNLYAMKKDNFIFRDTSRRNVDNGETSHQGLEANLDWQLSEAISINLAATYARHRYENNPALSSSMLDGNVIDTAPRTLGAATINWQVSDTFSTELEWVHVGRYFQDPENLNRYEGHDLLHLRSRWQINQKAVLSVRLMNISDEKYAERADFAFGSDRYFTGTPRSVYLGLSLHL